MKNLIYLLSLSLIVCISCSKENIEIESVGLEKSSAVDLKVIAEFMKGEKANNARVNLSKSDNNGNGVFFVSAVTSIDNNHGFFYPIPDTDLFMALDSPSDGRDRGIILDDTHMRLNWNIRNPRLFLYDVNTGIAKYTANYCDEDNTGLFKVNTVVSYTPLDINDDGEYDIYLYEFINEENGKNGVLKLKTTLTDALTSDPWAFPRVEDCGIATEEVEFSYSIIGHNTLDFTIDATFK